MTKVSVIMPTYNNEKYLEDAINSVLKQNFEDFELIIINDGSTDGTKKILEKFTNNQRIKILNNEKNEGLVLSCIKGIEHSSGEYIMRFDSDDLLDENALLILSTILDKHPDVALVYSDYFHINEKGELIDYMRLPKPYSENKILDDPAKASMFRKSVYLEVGGYSKEISCHEKLDLWLKILNKGYKVYKVDLPLFYYRQHEKNISKEIHKILDTRRKIKNTIIQKNKIEKQRILAIIPCRGTSHIYPNLPLKNLAGKPLISYTIEEVIKTELIDKIVVATEDEKVGEFVKRYKNVDVIYRSKKLGELNTPINPTINFVLKRLEKQDYIPDIVVVLFITSPLRKKKHIIEAINTLILFDADSVIPVKETKGLFYRYGNSGLEPLFKKRKLMFQRDKLFEEVGSMYVLRRKSIKKENLFGEKIAHIILPPEESIDIESKFDFWIVEKILEKQKLNNIYE